MNVNLNRVDLDFAFFFKWFQSAPETTFSFLLLDNGGFRQTSTYHLLLPQAESPTRHGAVVLSAAPLARGPVTFA